MSNEYQLHFILNTDDYRYQLTVELANGKLRKKERVLKIRTPKKKITKTDKQETGGTEIAVGVKQEKTRITSSTTMISNFQVKSDKSSLYRL